MLGKVRWRGFQPRPDQIDVSLGPSARRCATSLDTDVTCASARSQRHLPPTANGVVESRRASNLRRFSVAAPFLQCGALRRGVKRHLWGAAILREAAMINDLAKFHQKSRHWARTLCHSRTSQEVISVAFLGVKAEASGAGAIATFRYIAKLVFLWAVFCASIGAFQFTQTDDAGVGTPRRLCVRFGEPSSTAASEQARRQQTSAHFWPCRAYGPPKESRCADNCKGGSRPSP